MSSQRPRDPPLLRLGLGQRVRACARSPDRLQVIDTSTCIGCKACEVACQEWNDLATVPTRQTATYQTLPTLDAEFWNLIRFNEREVDGGIAWLMRKDQCMHCEEPGCLEACPAPGAIVQYANGIVDVNPDQCIGCGYCETGCPFDVPRFSAKTGKMAKCTLCVDRVSVGLEPACIKACPTGCLHFGTKDDMLALGQQRVEQLKANGFANAALYDPAGVGGTGVVTVLAHGDHPEWYGTSRRIRTCRWPCSSGRTCSAARRPRHRRRGRSARSATTSTTATRGDTDADVRRGLPTSRRRDGRGDDHERSVVRQPGFDDGGPARPARRRTSSSATRSSATTSPRASSTGPSRVTFFVCLFTGHADLDPGLRLDGGAVRRPQRLPRAPSVAGRRLLRRRRLAMAVHWWDEMKHDEARSGAGSDRSSSQYLRDAARPRQDVGKYNGGQKVYFWTSASAALGLLVVGDRDVVPRLVPALAARGGDPSPRRHLHPVRGGARFSHLPRTVGRARDTSTP